MTRTLIFKSVLKAKQAPSRRRRVAQTPHSLKHEADRFFLLLSWCIGNRHKICVVYNWAVVGMQRFVQQPGGAYFRSIVVQVQVYSLCASSFYERSLSMLEQTKRVTRRRRRASCVMVVVVLVVLVVYHTEGQCYNFAKSTNTQMRQMEMEDVGMWLVGRDVSTNCPSASVE
jgi:hypothetical protein